MLSPHIAVQDTQVCDFGPEAGVVAAASAARREQEILCHDRAS